MQMCVVVILLFVLMPFMSFYFVIAEVYNKRKYSYYLLFVLSLSLSVCLPVHRPHSPMLRQNQIANCIITVTRPFLFYSLSTPLPIFSIVLLIASQLLSTILL